jgi:hypothetical protein
MIRCSCGKVFNWKDGLTEDQVRFVDTNPVRRLISRCDHCNREVEVNL